MRRLATSRRIQRPDRTEAASGGYPEGAPTMSRITRRPNRELTEERHGVADRNGLQFLIFSALALVMCLAGPSAAVAGITPCDCITCHNGGHSEGGCSGCHDAPPQTPSHLTHYNSAPFQTGSYGDTEVQSTAEAYKFGCGNCHPLDSTKHFDGIVEVELFDALAPAGSLKAKNPPTAAYDTSTRTCSDVYCHSGFVVTSGAVGLPLTSPPVPAPSGTRLNNTFIMDETCSNLTYAPYDVFPGRAYATTPEWDTTGNITTCTECHEFPLTTYWPEVEAGVGDSHQWVDGVYRYNWRHAYNMVGDPIPCRTCHYDTVTVAGATQWVIGRYGAWIIEYAPIPLANRAAHVNGTPDVAFDTVNGFTYQSSSTNGQHDLTNATYDPTTKTCSNVTCHYNPSPINDMVQVWQQKPVWGGPARYYDGVAPAECDTCHRYGNLYETCTVVP